MTIVYAIVLIGTVWVALAFIGVAIFAALMPLIGMAGAAAATAGIFLLVALIGGLVLQRRIDNARRTAMIAGLASSGAANLLLGLVAKRPLLTLGIGGAVAAFLARYMSSSSRS